MLASCQLPGLEGSSRAAPSDPDLADRQVRAARMLAREFGPRRHGRVYATAHVLAEAGLQAPGMPAVEDFRLGEAQPLHALPAGFALPYACEFDTESLLFTIHPLPLEVLSAESVWQEQRRAATVGCRVHIRHLPRFYPLRAEAPAVSFVVAGDADARAGVAREAAASGRRSVTDPAALRQLATASTPFSAVRPKWRDGLLWASIAPCLSPYGAGPEAVVFIVPEVFLRIGAAVQALLPNASITGAAGGKL